MAGEVEQLSDRDLLIRIDTKLAMLEPRLIALEREIKEVDDRVSAIELAQASQRSFFDGAKAMWGFILSLPTGLIGLLAGYSLR